MSRTSGRAGTGHALYRKNRAILLAQSDQCGICGHGGSQTADHIISAKVWPRDARGKPLPGLDDLSNLRPAHGSMGAGKGRINACPVCGRICNQSRGARVIQRPTSRQWFPDRAQP